MFERIAMMKRKLLPLLLASLMLLCAILLPSTAEELSLAVSELASDVTLVKSGYLGHSVKFSQNDFKQALGSPDIKTITITSLPDEKCGTLFISSSRVSKGQNIDSAVLDLLKFVPVNETVEEASFTFTAQNLAGGAEIPCKIRLLPKKNEAPDTSGASLSVSTQSGISLYGTLAAKDPEGDALLFRITAYPKHGTLTLLDKNGGEYRYTPVGAYSGKDSFSYVVRDEYGNYSTEKTVTVTVKSRSSSLVYEDIAGTKTELAAISLTDKGVFLGRLSGDGIYFDPSSTITRGDFTVMAMKVAGISPKAELTETFFDDDADIPASIKGYLATAQKMGIINGSFEGDGLYFEPNRAVTRAEAAVILCNAMNLSAGDSTMVFNSYDDDVPVWAENAVTTLYTLGVMEAADGNIWNAKEALSKGDAALLLYGVMEK